MSSKFTLVSSTSWRTSSMTYCTMSKVRLRPMGSHLYLIWKRSSQQSKGLVFLHWDQGCNCMEIKMSNLVNNLYPETHLRLIIIDCVLESGTEEVFFYIVLWFSALLNGAWLNGAWLNGAWLNGAWLKSLCMTHRRNRGNNNNPHHF